VVGLLLADFWLLDIPVMTFPIMLVADKFHQQQEAAIVRKIHCIFV
jgi:hypothetical protein